MVAISWQENKEKTIKIFLGGLNSIFQTLLFDANLLLGRVSQSSVEEHPSSVISTSDWKHWDFFRPSPKRHRKKNAPLRFSFCFITKSKSFVLPNQYDRLWVILMLLQTYIFLGPPPQPVTSSLCYQGSGVRHLYLNSGCLFWIMLWLFQSLFNHRRRLERCGISPVRSRWVGECNSTKFLSRSFHRPIYF